VSWTEAGTAVGGLGLLLLGMGLLTDGLKRAAGASLQHLLGTWTRTRLRGLGAGALITAVVQSSSAVTVAIIGFANAGLLTLPQAAWVVFGSNVGTTMTGWLVALIGLRVQVEALALPFVGVGMLLRTTRPASRWGGLGEALAGFGTLFVGLDLLKATFSELGHALDLAAVEQWGFLGYVAGVGLGALTTVLMQSSSAAMAVILTARFQELVSAPFAAALVIGANVGTTSTALLSTIGATPNARRVASLHVAFNFLTGAVALALLAPLLAGIARLHELVDVPSTPAADLALFHTAFNLLGVLLMWPLSGALVRFLEARFRSAEEDAARPQHLDDNVLSVPELAARAILLELQRSGAMGLDLARSAVRHELDDLGRFGARARPVRRLLVSVADYSTRLNRTGLPAGAAEALTNLLRSHEHLWTMVRISGDLVGLRTEADLAVPRERAPLGDDYLSRVLAVLEAADVGRPDFDLERCRAAHEAHEHARKAERDRILELSASGRATPTAANQALQELGHHRRLVSRAWKLAGALQAVRVGLAAEGAPAPVERTAPSEPGGAEDAG